MIYLFEDRKGRMEAYFKDSLDINIIKIGRLDCKKDELETYLKENFADAVAILFHSSYLFSDKQITNEDVKNYFKTKKIPFVYFSGNMSNNLILENGLLNANVNSGDMYNNLSIFLEEYASYKTINIPKLVYGEKYLINSLMELQTLINMFLFDKTANQFLSENELFEIMDLTEARLKEVEFIDDKTKLLDWLKKGIEKAKIDKQILTDQIQKLIENVDLTEARLKEVEFIDDKTKLLDWLKKGIEKAKIDKQTLTDQIQRLIDKYRN